MSKRVFCDRCGKELNGFGQANCGQMSRKGRSLNGKPVQITVTISTLVHEAHHTSSPILDLCKSCAKVIVDEIWRNI